MTRLKTGALLVWLVLLTCLTPVRPVQVSGYQTLERGLEYQNERKTEGPYSIHVLRIDRGQTGWTWTTGLGEGRIFGLATVTRILRETAREQMSRPVAAINGDWFEINPGKYQGDPRGLQILNGEVVSAPAAYATFWVDPQGQPRMGLVESRWRVVWPDGKTETALGLNEHRPDDRAVLYTPSLAYGSGGGATGSLSTRTSDGRELLLEHAGEGDWLPLQVGKTYPARVAEVRATGNAPLGRRSVILSVGPQLLNKVPKVEPGAALTLKLETFPDLTGVKTALGGGPHLVKDGKAQPPDPNTDQARHPRSLLGWNRSHYFLVVVDGRQPKLSIGMTYAEMAALAVRLGCTEAMALDGGGSSTLWAGERVLNSPSGGEPRAVANALILLERQ